MQLDSDCKYLQWTCFKRKGEETVTSMEDAERDRKGSNDAPEGSNDANVASSVKFDHRKHVCPVTCHTRLVRSVHFNANDR